MLGITLTRNGPIPLSRQIRGQISCHILDGRLTPGDTLPSTRELAQALGVSRNTVTEAYDMLWAEGYLSRRQGARYSVQEGVRLGGTGGQPPAAALPVPVRHRVHHDFRTGLPDVGLFPFRKWNSLQRNILETRPPHDLLYGSARGYRPLRNAIAGWLLRSRGVVAPPRNIFITSGATHAIALALDVLARQGRHFMVENPCHEGVVNLLRLRARPFRRLDVDRQGLRLDALRGAIPSAVYTTPSHQFPLGWVMSAARRTSLIRLARQQDFTVIEDDYDSEYRYGGPPLAPLYSLDPERVIYIGTFSKTLFPALRIGYAVVPERCHQAWVEMRRYTDVQNPVAEQAVLAEFLDHGMMDLHIRKMTREYAGRREALLAAVEEEFGGRAEILGDGAGLHLALRLVGRVLGKDFVRLCRDNSILLSSVSRYTDGDGSHPDTLLLGYGAIGLADIPSGVRQIARMLKATEIRPPGK